MTKKIGALLAVLVLTGTQLFAQSFQLGIKGGGNLSDFISGSNSSQTSFSALAGWNAGVFVNFWLGNHFAIAPEILYTTQGAGIKTTTVINVGTATIGGLIGAGGYGQPILTGIRLADNNLILFGAVPAAILALLLQGSFGVMERLVLPRGLRLKVRS